MPANPFTDVAKEFVKFTNDAIDDEIKDDAENEIAKFSLEFANHPISDIAACKTSGKERTGAVAVLLSTGQKGAKLIPIQDADIKFCFSFTSQSIFSLVAVKRPDSGQCPTDISQFSEVPNDYVLFILNADPVSTPPPPPPEKGKEELVPKSESQRRCEFYNIPASVCE